MVAYLKDHSIDKKVLQESQKKKKISKTNLHFSILCTWPKNTFAYKSATAALVK